jgi:hypothetical protein
MQLLLKFKCVVKFHGVASHVLKEDKVLLSHGEPKALRSQRNGREHLFQKGESESYVMF